MSSTVIITIVSLSLLAFLSAVILYFIARKFKVFEDPRIDEVQAVLPAANCGGCGFAGCRNFAEALVKAETFEGSELSCRRCNGYGLTSQKYWAKRHLLLTRRSQFFSATDHQNSVHILQNMMVCLIAGLRIVYISEKQIAATVAWDTAIVKEHALSMHCIWIL